jgi:hypothetical protein
VRIAVCKYAERDAGILAVHDINKIVNDFVPPPFGGIGFDRGFGEAIEKNHQQSKNQPA